MSTNPKKAIRARNALLLLIAIAPGMEAQTHTAPAIVFEGGQPADQLAWSPSGYMATSNTDERTIKLWDMKMRRPVRTIRNVAVPHSFKNGAGETLEDSDEIRLWPGAGGKVLASSAGESIRIWGVDGRLLDEFKAGTKIEEVAFSADGQWVAAAADYGDLEAWRLNRPETHLVLHAPHAPPKMTDDEEDVLDRLALNPALAAKARLTPAQRDKLTELEDETDGNGSVAFTSGNQLIYASPLPNLNTKSANATANLIFQLSAPEHPRTVWIPGRKDDERILSRDGSWLAVLSDKELTVYRAFSGGKLWTLPVATTSDSNSSVRFSPDGRLLAVVTEGSDAGASVEICSAASGKVVHKLRIRQDLDGDELDGTFAVSHDGRELVVINGDYAPVIYSLDTGTQIAKLPDENDIGPAQISRDGKWFSFWSSNQRLTIWDTATGGRVASLPANDDFTMSADGRRIATVRIGASAPQSGGGDAQTAPETRVQTWDVLSGQLLHEFIFHPRFGETGVDGMALSHDGSLLAIQDDYAKVTLYNAETGKILHAWDRVPDYVNTYRSSKAIRFDPAGQWLAQAVAKAQSVYLYRVNGGGFRIPAQNPQCLAFSSDGKQLAIGNRTGRVAIWDLAGPKMVRAIAAGGGIFGISSVAFSSDGGLLASGGSDGSVKLWNAETGALLHHFGGHISPVTGLVFGPGHSWLASTPSMTSGDSPAEATRLWDVKGGQLLASVASASGGNWIVVSPNGLFDGSPGAWDRILWRFNNQTFDVAPVEIFFREFFDPGLLEEILSGKHPQADANIANIDRRQPVVTLERADHAPPGHVVTSRDMNLVVHVTGAAPEAEYTSRGGVQDVRLFRNGALVKVWRGVQKLDAQGNAVLEVELPIIAGDNQFTAYAYSAENIKSTDATLDVQGAASLKRPGIGYVLAIGINKYEDSNIDLRFAVADVTDFAAEFAAQQKKVGNYASMKITLLDDENATKANILGALRRLAGADADTFTAAQQKLFANLAPVKPEDGLFVYYAGHGHAIGQHFYLLPHDMVMPEKEQDLAKPQAHTISDQELGDAFERISAGRTLLVIDACESGELLGTSDERMGPMNSKGLAQMAYEKGMYILTAAQGYQAALESPALGGGHGFLTYALVERGLKTKDAAVDGEVELRRWLNFAAHLVPQLQLALMEKAQSAGRGFAILPGQEKIASPEQRTLQRPRVFFRREPDNQPFIVARP